jgi:peptidoglycan-associated lipoprotein
MKKITISLLLVSLLAACASQKPKEAPVQESKPAPAAEAPKAAPVETPAMSEAAPAPVAAAPVVESPSRRSVYFPFDVSAVQDEDKPTVQAHAKFLSEHASVKVRLEGNCDERGSDEYNLGLGQRRADSVKKMLLVGGANASQISTISYGEERPKLTCHEERCWKENRRTDFNYNAQ